MSRRDERHGSSGRRNESRRYDGYKYQDIDPEYDARTYTGESRHNPPVTQTSSSSGNSRQPKPSLVNYDYASDDSPIVHTSSHKKRDRKRSASRSPTAVSKREKKDSKKSKKKKKSRSISRDRESSSKRHKSKKSSPSPAPHPQSPEIIKIVSPPKRRASPPRQYSQTAAKVPPPPGSPPRAYQSGGKSRKDHDTDTRMHRSRDRTPPVHRRSSKSPTSPFG